MRVNHADRRAFPSLHLPAVLLAVLLGGGPITSGCAEEPARRPSPQVRCDQFRASFERAQDRLDKTEALEVLERIAYGAVIEGCLVWREDRSVDNPTSAGAPRREQTAEELTLGRALSAAEEHRLEQFFRAHRHVPLRSRPVGDEDCVAQLTRELSAHPDHAVALGRCAEQFGDRQGAQFDLLPPR